MAFSAFVHRVGTPGMAINLWGVSPLYENESLKEGSLPTVTPIDKLLDEGNCGRAIDRGKEACECAVKLILGLLGQSSLQPHRLQPHSRQSCEATDRNLIQGRWGEVSEPAITKPFSLIRIGKLGACAAKVNRLILGELMSGTGSRLDAESRWSRTQVPDRHQQSAEAIVLVRHTPLSPGRAEHRKNKEELLKHSHRGITPTGVNRCGARQPASLGSVSLLARGCPCGKPLRSEPAPLR